MRRRQLNSWYVATRWRVAGKEVSYWEIWFSGPEVSLSASAIEGVKLPMSVEVRPVIRAPWARDTEACRWLRGW